ncbi:MAG: LysR family transcriptional regulator [Propionicimonas sp.]|uniref:LysR family transcriptional regulator n=1 Tax=Propionicimonas sp. TaxID=1955623 RepID=UPI003D0A04AE
MDIRHIKEFAVLAEVQNYLEASDLLFISQSSLSKHIKALEAELGAPLFDRSTRHVRLNEAGAVFLEFARQVVALQYQTATRIRTMTSQRAYALTIGSIPVMAPYGILDAIAAFRRENADFSVSLIEGDAKALKDALRRNECELAFIRDDGEDDPTFSKIPFAQDALAAVLPATHALVGRKTVRLTELAQEDFMLLSPGSLLHELSVKACEDAGFEPKVVFTGQRAENILDLVSQGMGVGLLMRKAAKRLVRDRVAIIEVVPPVTTFVKIYYRSDQQLSPTARHFIDSVIVNQTITSSRSEA